MASIFTRRNGTKVRLLNPSEKAKKYVTELKEKKRFTNFGEEKDKELTSTGASYRMGYLAARSDNAKAYKSNKEKKSKSKAKVKKQETI